MAIQNDFTIYPETKVIRHTSGTTVYSAVAFYSYLMDTFDEPGYLTYETPISFNTPTSFTIVNGWFLDNGDGSNILQYLTGGGIDTSGYATVSDPIYMMDVDTEVAAFVSGDLDKDVRTNDTDTVGPLLSFKANYPSATTARCWFRDVNSIGAPGAAEDVDVPTGTGDYTNTGGGAASSGDEIYHNLFTIASFPTDLSPQVYVYQNHPVSGTRTRIAEWSAFTNWDRGSIDVLIPVKLGGSLIDSGNISTFVRQTGDSFTFVESTLNTSGRTPIATETSADEVNITVGENYLLYDASNTGSFTADDVISDVDLSAGVPPTWYAEVVAIEEFGVNTTGLLTLRSLRGTITDNDAIYVSNVQEALANGKVGDTIYDYTGGTDATTVDQILTASGGGLRLQSGVDIAEDRLVSRVDDSLLGSNKDAYYIVPLNTETVTGATEGSITLTANATTLISGFSDVTVAHMNGTITTGAAYTGTFELGETLSFAPSGATAVLINANSLTAPTTMMLGNVTTTEPTAADGITGDSSGATAACDSVLTDDNTEGFEFSLQSTGALYSVFIEGGSVYNAGRSLTDIYAYLQYYLRDGQSISDRIIYTSNGSSITQVAAEEYIKAASGYSATKPAPFGTLAGGVFFGAQAVWIQGMQSSDDNNIKLLDSTGTLRQPFTAITLTISNTRADDRIAVYLESGTTTLPDKTQYTSGTNAQSASTFVRNTASAFPNDTPSSGTFIVVDNTVNEEHRYRYDSYTGTPGTFTLPGELTGTTDSSTSGQVFEDSSENFTAGGTSAIQVGDIIRDVTTSQWCYVTDISSAASGILGTTLMNDGTGWTATDTYEMLSLVEAYTSADTFFVPYLDAIEDTGTEGTPGTVTQSLTYADVDREVVIEIRNVEATTQIVPFKTTGTITSNGLTQSVIRTEDTVYV